jgi:hypothetical protein
MFALTLLMLLSLDAPVQGPDQSAVIEAAKGAIAGDLDKALPRLTVEEWLRGLAGAERVVAWEMNDCGEQTGGPADRGRDFPLCAEARVRLPDNRTLGLLFAVGSQRRGISDAVSFFYGYLAGPLPNQMVWLKTLAEVARHLPADRSASGKGLTHVGGVLDEKSAPSGSLSPAHAASAGTTGAPEMHR